jgi:hypothetical protein
MRQFMMAMALAAFGVMVATAQAESQTPNPPTASHPVKKRAVSHTARPAQAPTFAACQKKALDLGLLPGQAGHNAYVRGCMGGVITPGRSERGDFQPRRGEQQGRTNT